MKKYIIIIVVNKMSKTTMTIPNYLLNNFLSFCDLSSRANHSSNKNSSFRFPTPQFLIDNYDFPDLDLHISEATITKISNFHGVPIDFLKKLPTIFSEHEEYISYIFKSNTQEDSSVVCTFDFVGSKPIIIAIKKNKQINTDDYVNSIASIYEKDNAEVIFKEWKRKGLLLYKNPKKDLIFPVKEPIIKEKRKIRTQQLEQKD